MEKGRIEKYVVWPEGEVMIPGLVNIQETSEGVYYGINPAPGLYLRYDAPSHKLSWLLEVASVEIARGSAILKGGEDIAAV